MKIATILSTKGGPGKTTVTANLGAFCADANIRTLLIDLDSRPSLSSFYRLEHEAPFGTYQLISQNETLPDLVISRTCIPNLSLILSNDPHNQLSNMLLYAADGRLRLRNLMSEFALDYDLILIDTQGARSVTLETALLCSDLAISPITPDMLAAREFYRGTQQLLKDLTPLASLGVHTPPLNIVINKLDATNDASLIYQSLVETLADHPQINLLDTTIPAAVSFRRAATEGIPARIAWPVPMTDILPCGFRQIAVSVEEGMIVQPDFQVLEMMGGIPGEPMDLLIRTGVSLEAIDNLSRHGVSAVSVGIINARTLRHRRTKGERLSPEEGDRLYRVSKLVVLAEQVFGDKDKAARWLNKAQKVFGGLTALEAAVTTPGYVAAEETLERINHGFFA